MTGSRRYEVLELLSCLVDKSLVVVARGDAESRYRMLETVRQYASETLKESGEDGSVGATPRGLLRRPGRGGETGLVGPEQAAWLERLEDGARQPEGGPRAVSKRKRKRSGA